MAGLKAETMDRRHDYEVYYRVYDFPFLYYSTHYTACIT